jgi:drug/metabolite transporter (DMT)-like permease
MNSPSYIIIFIACVFIGSCAQILLKISAKKKYSGVRIYLNKESIIGYILFFGINLIMVFLYRNIELSAGILLESSGYIIVPVLSLFFLEEKLGKRTMIGLIFILAGISVYAVFGVKGC